LREPLDRNLRIGGDIPVVNKRNLVFKLLANPRVRRTLINFLKNPRVRRAIFKQIERRIRHR
jgi:hypothetical protein